MRDHHKKKRKLNENKSNVDRKKTKENINKSSPINQNQLSDRLNIQNKLSDRLNNQSDVEFNYNMWIAPFIKPDPLQILTKESYEAKPYVISKIDENLPRSVKYQSLSKYLSKVPTIDNIMHINTPDKQHGSIKNPINLED